MIYRDMKLYLLPIPKCRLSLFLVSHETNYSVLVCYILTSIPCWCWAILKCNAIIAAKDHAIIANIALENFAVQSIVL